ncbi:MAG: bifunctional adenosylcobinamide kinase/adenosylcobinamide-phosphate guanylyltransferase [Candidatus Omnitrophica bacterium]|nr:bifunctional adenosylcobinamide kinase/adenosylcobinamide-phosphate guanylyltransferase [Candidatus Omnitrophota bacterium]
MGKIVFVIGGARSGKSKFAMELAKKEAKEVVYIATTLAQDEEMKLRIKKHIKSRPKDWKTIEEPLDLPRAIRNIKGKGKVVLIDCITLYISNVLLKGYSEKKKPREINRLNDWILEEAGKMVSAINASPHIFIIVSNEVGMSIVPENRLARLFRDIHGETNQIISRNAESVYMVVAGIPTKIK